MQLHDPLLQLPGLVGGESEVTDVIAAMVVVVIVTELGLDGVGAHEGVSDEGAGQPA